VPCNRIRNGIFVLMKKTKKWYHDFLSASSIITLASWIVMGSFYIGVHKTEMAAIKNGQEDISAKIELAQKDFGKLNIEGSTLAKKHDGKLELLENSIKDLEKSKALAEQYNINSSKEINGMDARIRRVEEAITEVVGLKSSVASIKESQAELKADIRDLKNLLQEKTK
jgi:hypothetical protein